MAFPGNTLHLGLSNVYKHDSRQMLLPHEFFLPFAGQLNPENRWCKLAAVIPWDVAEERYKKALGNLNAGQKAYSVRLALGTLIIQKQEKLVRSRYCGRTG